MCRTGALSMLKNVTSWVITLTVDLQGGSAQTATI